jgi:uncharacterized delta-60 repeat protein
MKRTRIVTGMLTLALLLPLALTLPARADLTPGHLDTGFDPGTGADDEVLAVAVQPDGKVIIGGNFTTFGGTGRNRIARLNADGSLDTSFDPGTGTNNRVYAVAVQTDGKVLIGGSFTTVNGTARNRIARLNGDGSLDTSFDPGTGANNTVRSVIIQSDGKVLIGGDFTEINGTSRNHIARLKANGSMDTGFDPADGASGTVYAVALQPGGKVLIGGSFITVDGTARNRIARLNANGSLDTVFNPGSGANNWVDAVAVQPDGKVLIGGVFATVDGTSRAMIARLNTDGSLDASFDPGAGANAIINDVAVQSDGKVLIGGAFATVDGTARNRIARLNTDGSLDASFDPGAGANDTVWSVAVQPDGKVFIGGKFTTVSGTGRNRIARLHKDGSLDIGLDSSIGASNQVQAVVHQSDGKVLIGGYFTTVDGTTRNYIARLNANGSLETGFAPVVDGAVLAAALQPDGKVLIGGGFTDVDGTTRNHIARLKADGSLDASGFIVGAGANDGVYAVALQANEKVLIGGPFTEVNNTKRNRIARLNANGFLDSGFDPGVGPGDGMVLSVAVQSDGKVLIGGTFTAVDCVTHKSIARLNTDGSLDASFDPGTGANFLVRSVAVQSDGKVLIGGDFTTFNGTTRNRIARLNAAGSLDTSFDPGTGANGSVRSVVVQSDGKVVIAGAFTTVNGTVRTRIARLNADGSVDAAFDTSTGANNTVWDVAVQPDGRVLIGGDFTTVDGTTRNRIARLNGNRTFYVSKDRTYYDMFPSYSTIQAAVNVAGDGDLIKVGQGDYDEAPVRSTAGMATINGGWNETFDAQTPNTTSMHAPSVSQGGLRLQMLRVIP